MGRKDLGALLGVVRDRPSDDLVARFCAARCVESSFPLLRIRPWAQ